VAVTGVVAIVTLGVAQAAFAAPPEGYGTARYGYDGTPQAVAGGGSDTTYRAQLAITDLWNQSGLNGCLHNTSAGTTQDVCQTDLANSNLGNYDGDNLFQANPVGSGGGINSVNGQGGASATLKGTVNPIANPTRTDVDNTATLNTHHVALTNGSPTVTDDQITAGDLGKSVVGTGIPKASYVGTVTPGVSFQLSSAPSEQLNVNATASVSGDGTQVIIQPYDCVVAQANPEADFARSSRTANTPSGGNATCGDELRADTFWGYAQDGVSVIGFNNHGTTLSSLTGLHLSPDELFKIWGCFGGSGTGGRMEWADLGSSFSGDTSEIVPWSMNTSSGTYNTFRDYIRNNATLAGHGTFDPNTTGACVRKLSGGGVPLENDIKNIINDQGITLSATASSPDNPENWMWWGSFGVFSAFPYTSNFARQDGTVHTLWVAKSAAINGITPGTGNILQLTYPISRTLFHVTRKADADCVKSQQLVSPFALLCDFTNHNGPAIPAPTPSGSSTATTDLNVTGGVSGVGGAVREYTRFLCRKDGTQQGINPFDGLNNDTEITAAINSAGFTTIKTSSKTPGSRCVVLS
jgi:hypothetical protein